MKIQIDDLVRDMTPEEEAEFYREHKQMISPGDELSAEEIAAAIEEVLA